MGAHARGQARRSLRRGATVRPHLPERGRQPRVHWLRQELHHPCARPTLAWADFAGHGFSPDAFVQAAFQAAYFSLCVRRLLKAGLMAQIRADGVDLVRARPLTAGLTLTASRRWSKPSCTAGQRRSALCSPRWPTSCACVTLISRTALTSQTFCSDATPRKKIDALRKAVKGHTELTKNCSAGQGQVRLIRAGFADPRRTAFSTRCTVWPSARSTRPRRRA